jgi:hypothetical protein
MTDEQAKAHADAKAELAAMKAAGQIESYDLTRHDPDYHAPHYRIGVRIGGEWHIADNRAASFFTTLADAMEATRQFVTSPSRQPVSDELQDVMTCHDSEGM